MAETQSTQVAYLQSTTGKLHTREDCGVTRRTRYDNHEIELDDSLRQAIADGTYTWCGRCFKHSKVPAEFVAPRPESSEQPKLTFQVVSRTGTDVDTNGETLETITVERELGKSTRDQIIAKAAECGWLLEHGYERSVGEDRPDGLRFHSADATQGISLEFGAKGQITWCYIGSRTIYTNRREVVLHELGAHRKVEVPSVPAETKPRFTVRKQSSGYSHSETFYVYDTKRKGRVSVHASARECAQADADSLNAMDAMPEIPAEPTRFQVGQRVRESGTGFFASVTADWFAPDADGALTEWVKVAYDLPSLGSVTHRADHWYAIELTPDQATVETMRALGDLAPKFRVASITSEISSGPLSAATVCTTVSVSAPLTSVAEVLPALSVLPGIVQLSAGRRDVAIFRS